MKLKNKLEVEETLEVGVLPNAPTNNFSVVFETAGMFQRRQVGNIINKNDTDFLPSVSNSFPTSVFAFNVSTTNANPNLTVSFVNQVAGTVFAAPQSLNGTPAFRMLQDSDLSQTSLGSKQNVLTTGDHIDITADVISVKPTLNTWIEDSGNNNRILMSTVSSGTNHNDMVLKQISSDGYFKLRNAQDEDFFVYKNNTQELMMPLVGTSSSTVSNILMLGSNGAIWRSNRTIGDFALANGSNLTNIQTWRNSLGIGTLNDLTTTNKSNLVNAINEVKGSVPNITNLVPYTGANQTVDLNTQTFTIGGDFEKTHTTFEKSYLDASIIGTSHFTRLTDVASFSRSNDTTTQSDCIVITLPIRASTHWVMEVDIVVRNDSGMFKAIPTKLAISAYSTSNSLISVTAISGADNVKSVSFCRDGNNNTVVIIRSQDGVPTNFSYGKVNIANFYHGVIYNSALADKSNYNVDAVLESDLTGLTTNGTITNEQFTRDSYLWNKGDFTQTNVDNWNTAFGWGNHANLYTRWLNTTTGADITTPSTSRFNPDATNPVSSQWFAGITYGNNGNVTGQLFTHFQTGESYLRGYNTSFSAWRKIWDSGNFDPAQYVLQSSLNTQLANYVPINGVTTINNTKTFTSSPIVPNATLNSHAVNLGQLNSLLPTVNDGQLTLTTGAGLSGSGTFTANQSGNSSFSVGIASTHKLPTVAEWNALPTTNTTYTSSNGIVLVGTDFRLSAGTLASLALADSSLQSGDDISELNNDAGYITASSLPNVGNGNITYSGIGDITGGGTSTANQSGNTDYTFDLTAQTKSNIALGVTAHGWGDFRDYGLGLSNNIIAVTNADTHTPTSFSRVPASFIGSPFPGANQANQGYLNTFSWGSGSAYKFQEHIPINANIARRYRIKNNFVWGDWVTGIDSNNLDSQATSLGFIKSSALGSYVLQSSLNTQLANYGTLAGTQTWTGQNTYTQAPYIPAGTLDGHAVNLGQLNTILGDYATETWVTQQINNISIPTVNNGQLTLSTGTGLSGSANFTANQSGNSSFSVGIASTHKLPTVAEWNALPTTNTITRLRGTTSGTYTSGDLTLLAGANTTITQSGATITIASTNTNTTYTAGTGLTLSGTVFGQAITTSGTGTYVQSITQTASGFQVNLGTPPNTNTTYTGSNGINVTGTVISPTYGTTANTIAQGNDSRINNGQTAFGWGNHALAGYLTSTALNNYYQSGDVNIPTLGGDYVVFPKNAPSAIFDFDTITEAGFYKNMSTLGSTNAPKGGYWYVENLSYGGSNLTQYAHPYRVTDGKWMRSRFSGNWTSWVEFIHSGNLASYANKLLTGFVPTSRTLTINGTTFDLSQDRTWTIPDNDTITRLRGTTSGTYTSGDLTLLAGTNVSIVQSGSDFTINATDTNTTYTAGSGLTLTGTVFSLPITYSGTGNYVSDITQTTNGLTVTRDTLPTVNNGSFTVQGTGSLTGSGSTSANASANTTADLDLTTAEKDRIQQGVWAYAQILPLIDGVDYHHLNTGGHVPIEKKKTIVNIPAGSLGYTINVDDALYDGYELAINGCGEWSVTVNGSIMDKCGDTDSITLGWDQGGSALFWWSADLGMWIQAI